MKILKMYEKKVYSCNMKHSNLKPPARPIPSQVSRHFNKMIGCIAIERLMCIITFDQRKIGCCRSARDIATGSIDMQMTGIGGKPLKD